MYTTTDALHRAERLSGSHVAVVCGDVRLTYADLTDRVRRSAAALRSLQVGPGDRVATLMLNCHSYLESYFAVPGIGAVLVPLNNRHAVAEHRYICEDAGVRVLLVDEAHAEVAELLRDMVRDVVLVPDEYERMISDAEPEPLARDLDPETLAGLFYTGGTTGAAKGVMLSHRNLMANAMHTALALGYEESDTYLHAAPMFHQADAASTYAVTWLGGGHAFVPAFAPQPVLDVISRESVSIASFVPVMINALVNEPALATANLSSLRRVMHGGAPIAPELLRRAIAALGCSFTQGYGMTEAAPILTVLRNEEALVDSPRLTSAGRQVAGVQVVVRRPDGVPCDTDEVGEITARGPNIMQGYWNKAAETAAVLKDGWYWSGDLGKEDDEGYLFVVDRAKDMIISGGENVYSVEVEAALYAHPAVLECAVFAVPDEEWGEAVHAVVVAKPASTVTARELQAWCKERIAGFKIPKSITFTDALPKSGAGKILKRDLREPFWASAERQVH
ncbi:MAG: putative fatty-acid--CoA ligase [Frankiales bacterium]|nr:putative fatty-acid--CoA ligase [Frankiales bacterium]